MIEKEIEHVQLGKRTRLSLFSDNIISKCNLRIAKETIMEPVRNYTKIYKYYYTEFIYFVCYF